MSLSGTFLTMPFPDLLQWLGDARKSGTLTVALDYEERFFRLKEGELIGLGSEDPRTADLGRLLVARGLLDDPALARALEERNSAPRRLLRQVLVENGYVKADDLATALRSHAKDVMLQVFLWDRGRFLFADAAETSPLSDDSSAPTAGELTVEPPITTRELLMDGMRRIDEWTRIAEVLPSDYTVIHAKGRAADLPILDTLLEVGEPISIGELLQKVPRTRFDVYAELYEAHRRKLLAIDATPHAHASDGQSPVDVLLATAKTLLGEKQFDEAATMLRSALDLDPYHSEARELLAQTRAEHLEALYREFPPYKIVVPAVERARLDEVQETLGPRERMILSRIDGRWDVAALTVMTPIGELETLRCLKKLQHAGVIALE